MKNLYFRISWESLFLLFTIFVLVRRINMFAHSSFTFEDWAWLMIIFSIAAGCWYFGIKNIKNSVWKLHHPRTNKQLFYFQTKESISKIGAHIVTDVSVLKGKKESLQKLYSLDLDTSLWKKISPNTLVSKRNKRIKAVLPDGFMWQDPQEVGVGKVVW